MIGAVQSAIENIALKEQLKKLEVKIKKDYHEVFEEILHVKDLPVDYMACIKLKEAYNQISGWSYTCPQKYCEAFKMLIEQHLEAGRTY